jgi:hypothetical protein
MRIYSSHHTNVQQQLLCMMPGESKHMHGSNNNNKHGGNSLFECKSVCMCVIVVTLCGQNDSSRDDANRICTRPLAALIRRTQSTYTFMLYTCNARISHCRASKGCCCCCFSCINFTFDRAHIVSLRSPLRTVVMMH